MDSGRHRNTLSLARIVALLCAVILSFQAAAADSPNSPSSGEVVRASLANGLRVIIVRNTLAPVVSSAVNYLVGADETPPGFPGMAHAQEHMMFRGVPGLSADQLAHIGSLMGGHFNANTQQTVTQYVFTVPAEDLDIVLHIEALRMSAVVNNAKDWINERGALEQEVSQNLSNPTYVLHKKLRGVLFKGTSYAHDALGTRSSFNKTTATMLKNFYARWYAPNNAILVIVGDIDPAATLAKVSQLFGAIPRKTLPSRRAIKLRPVRAQSLQLKSNLPYGMQVIAMRMPGLDSPDYAASQVLADVLSSQRGALHELASRGKALFTNFSIEPLAKAGLGYAIATFPVGGNAKALEREVRTVLDRIVRDGVPPDLVEAAKLKERVAAETQKNSIDGLAGAWSEAVAVDGIGSPEEGLARIEKVTVDDVNRVARKYLDFNHAVVATLVPQISGKKLARRGPDGPASIALGESKPTPLPDWAGSVLGLGQISVPAPIIQPVVSRLSNGITLIVQPETVGNSVSLYGHIKNRPELALPAGKEGLDMVLEQLFSYGSKRLDRIAFQRALDEIGAQGEAGADFQVSVLKDHFADAVDLLAENQFHPALPEEAFTIVREQVVQAVAGRLKSPGYLFQRALHSALFPTGDPTLREALPQTVSALTLDDVGRYYRAAFRPDLTVIVVVGNISPAEAKAVVEQRFGKWKAAGPMPETTLPAVPANAPAQLAIPDASRVQDRAVLAQTIGISRSSPDYYALKLGNTVLAARLIRDLRKNAGLVYAIKPFLDAGQTRSVYYVQYACDPQNVAKVHASAARELEEMRTVPVTADELQRAKAMLLRQIPLVEASTDAIAQGLIARWELDLPLDEPTLAARRYVDLSAEDVKSAFAKWLRPGDLVRVTQGSVTR